MDHDEVRIGLTATMGVTGVADVGSAHLLRALASGRLPVHRGGRAVGPLADPVAALPPGSEVVLDSVDGGPHQVVGVLPDAVVHLTARREVTHVAVVGRDLPLVERLLADVVAAVGRPADGLEDAVRMRMWSWRGSYADMASRRVAAPAWREVAGNYGASTAAALAPLMALPGLDGRAGRLVLWHGEPGTGKTTAVRALAREWAGWCQTHYVADPERLFADPGYLLEVAGGDDQPADGGEDDEAPGWRLVVAEDCDEYLHADAKQRSGASLGRLLNLCDGILGHGLRVAVLLTTNEDLTSLHPAVTRPGRCLGEVEFAAFTRAEAGAWLGDDAAAPAYPVTLAQLYAIREQRHPGGRSIREPAGYL